MERKLEISRKSCVNGLWEMEKEDGTSELVSPSKMMELYISRAEGNPVSLDNLSQFSRLSMRFEPDDPRDLGGHGVEGKVYIAYEFRSSPEES